MVNIGEKLYLYGGKCSVINHHIYELNLETFTWTEIPKNLTYPGTHFYSGRFFHQSFSYNNHFYSLGGEINYNDRMKIRECSSDLYMYNTSTKNWSN
jgi:hypothetical protein